MNGPFNVTKKRHIQELLDRVPPILNVNVVIVKDHKYLVGKRNRDYKNGPGFAYWMFPGGRMKYNETTQDACVRIIQNETGLNSSLRKLITAISDMGWDNRANGVTLYYLCKYHSGEPITNEQFTEFKWVNKEELLALPRAYVLDQSVVNEIDLAIRTSNTTEDELLVEVDADDKEIGTIIKREAHTDPSHYHRAAHIMIFNSKGQVILQQRGWNKSHHPGKWDMIGGHQVAGQTIEQCALSELSEELGITTDLKFFRKGLYQDNLQSEYYYLYYGIHDGPYGFDRNEVETVSAFNGVYLLERKYDKDYEILPHVYGYITELKAVWNNL